MKKPKALRPSGEEIEAFRRACRERGIRVTPQRLEIFREIAKASDHPSAEEVHRRVKARLGSVSLDTVYRTLTTFEQWGLISRVHFLEDRTRFDPNRTLHHHMFCTECKEILDFHWADFDNAVLPAEVRGWCQPGSRHAQVRGICAKCRGKRSRRKMRGNRKRNGA